MALIRDGMSLPQDICSEKLLCPFVRLWILTKVYVLMEIVDTHVGPNIGVDKSSWNNLCSWHMLNNRQSLSEVTTKQHSNTFKWNISIQQVPQSMIHSLQNIMVLRSYFIPNDKRGVLKELMSKVILLDFASTLFMYGNGDLEARMGCMTTRK